MIRSLLSFLKNTLPPGNPPRTILSGLYRGLRMRIDLHSASLIWLGLYEKETHQALRSLIHGCRSFIDLGAGHGELVCYLLRYQPGAPVIAVEPDPTALGYLMGAVRLNHTDIPGTLSVLSFYCGTGGPKPNKSLSDIARDLPTSTRPTLVKIDVDGPEADILAESSAWIEINRPRFFIETHSPDAESRIIELLTSFRYEVTIIHPAWWRRFLPEYRPITHNRWLCARPLLE